MIAFTIPGKPQGKGRARSQALYAKGGKPITSASGRVIVTHHTPDKTVAYESLIAHVAHLAMRGIPLFVEGGMAVSLSIDCDVPGSWSLKKQRMALAGEVFPTTKPDVDNVVKAVFDGCNGVVWRDDVQVVDLRICKRYAATPSVRVEIWPIEQVHEVAAMPKAVERAAQPGLFAQPSKPTDDEDPFEFRGQYGLTATEWESQRKLTGEAA